MSCLTSGEHEARRGARNANFSMRQVGTRCAAHMVCAYCCQQLSTPEDKCLVLLRDRGWGKSIQGKWHCLTCYAEIVRVQVSDRIFWRNNNNNMGADSSQKEELATGPGQDSISSRKQRLARRLGRTPFAEKILF